MSQELSASPISLECENAFIFLKLCMYVCSLYSIFIVTTLFDSGKRIYSWHNIKPWNQICLNELLFADGQIYCRKMKYIYNTAFSSSVNCVGNIFWKYVIKRLKLWLVEKAAYMVRSTQTASSTRWSRYTGMFFANVRIIYWLTILRKSSIEKTTNQMDKKTIIKRVRKIILLSSNKLSAKYKQDVGKDRW